MKRLLLMVTLVLALAACGGGGGTTSGDPGGGGGSANAGGNNAGGNNPGGNPPNNNPGAPPPVVRAFDLVNRLLPGRGRVLLTQISAQLDPTVNAGFLPRISPDGRFVAFISSSPDLVEGDNDDLPDLFVRDMTTSTTARIELPNSATPAVRDYAFSSNSEWVGVGTAGPGWYLLNIVTGENFSGSGFLTDTSSDGTRVVYWQPGTPSRVFIFDRVSGQTLAVTPTANSDSLPGRFSRDGALLYFYSEASNLVPNDTNGAGDVFAYRFSTGDISRVSILPGGVELNAKSLVGRDSSDGRYYVFPSEASNITPGDTNGVNDIFVKDMVTGQIALVSRAIGGPANGESLFPSISGDGKWIAFNSRASNLVASDTNSISDVFLYNRETDSLVGRVSLTSDNKEARGGSDVSRSVEISLDGSWIVFTTDAVNMIAGLPGGYSNIYRTNAVVPTLFAPPGPHANALEYILSGDANIDLSPFNVAGNPNVTGEVPIEAQGGVRTLQARITVPGQDSSRSLFITLQFDQDTISVGDQVILPSTAASIFYEQQSTIVGSPDNFAYISGDTGTMTIVGFQPGPGTGGTIGIRLDNWKMVPSPTFPLAMGSFTLNGTITITIP